VNSDDFELKSIADVMENPEVLRGKTVATVPAIIKEVPGWREETLGKGSRQGQGWVLREYGATDMPTGRMIRWHPGGGHHGPNPYWRVNTHQTKSSIIPAGSSAEE
jgi:hypothetical protein